MPEGPGAEAQQDQQNEPEDQKGCEGRDVPEKVDIDMHFAIS
jgi:hypothetical protein